MLLLGFVHYHPVVALGGKYTGREEKLAKTDLADNGRFSAFAKFAGVSLSIHRNSISGCQALIASS